MKKGLKNIQTFEQHSSELNTNSKPFKSNLKVKYDNDLGMWVINGKSLQRTDIDGMTFYDKKSADDFKKIIDNQDFYFYHDNK